MTGQVEAHQEEEMGECLLYNSSEVVDAGLIGVEYIISENMFMTLPDAEKPLWHSHEYEVKGGFLSQSMPAGPIQRQDLEKVCKTYGKPIHFWQIDDVRPADNLPLGLPQMMISLTLAHDVEKRFGRTYARKRGNRANYKKAGA